MVSIANNPNMSFSNSALNNDEEEANLDEIDHEEDNEDLVASATDETNAVFHFKSVDTMSVGIFQICSSVGMFIVSTVLPLECKTTCALKPFSILLYLHCFFWGLFLICDQYVQYEHIKVRRRGYLEFYNDTRTLCQMPFWIVSAWSTLLLTISTILNDNCDPSGICNSFISLKKSEYIAIGIGLEIIVLISVLVMYLYRVFRFNTIRQPPDVLRDDMNSSTMDFGPKSFGPIDDEIFERQADLIRFYHDQNDMLRRKVLELNYQLSGRSAPTLS